MKMRYKIGISGILILLLSLPSMMADEQYGDITCTEKFVPVHKFECRRPDLSIEKVFQTESQMNAWYDPYRDVTFIPQVTYGWTVSNMGI